MAAIFLAVVVRYGTEAALSREVPLAETLRVPLLVTAYAILLLGTWANRRQPGMAIAFVGILSNAVVIAVNGGHMPIWEPSLVAAGLTPADVDSPIHVILPPPIDAEFLAHLGPLGDVIPIPVPVVRNVASIGDVVVSLGLGFFLFASVLRTPAEATAEEVAEAAAETPEPHPRPRSGARGFTACPERPPAVAGGIRPETGLIAGLSEASVLRRPVLLGSESPALTEAVGPGTVELWPGTRARRPASAVTRTSGSPSIGSFSALWTSELISLFGDRLNQIALGVIVLAAHRVAGGGRRSCSSPPRCPNLLLGPISGTLVDRWDQKQVLVVSDLLRAAIVLLIPIAATTNVVPRLPA